MTDVVSPWRAAYEPGDSLVLAGPTSLVILDSSVDLHRVGDLWEVVLASGSLTEMAHALARHLGRVSRAAAFFWSPEGIRSLLRGDVKVLDPATSSVVADGAGVLTWKEVGLGELDRICVEFGPLAGEDSERSRLPLVVGVVRASSVWLEARPSDVVRSPQAEDEVLDHSPEPSAAPEPAEALDVRPEQSDRHPSETELLDTELPDTEPPDTEPMTGVLFGPRSPMTQTVVPVPAPAIAQLHGPDGSTVELDRSVLIGRAPAASEGSADRPHLMTVASPNHDVSRTHVEVWIENGEVVVNDLSSTNGTLIIGPAPAEHRVPLRPGIPLAVPIGSRINLGGEVAVLVAAP